MEITQVHTLNLTGVLSESKRIILSRYWHFLSLSSLFFSLSLSLINTSNLPFSHDHINPNHQKQVISYILYTAILHVHTLCAIGTITYSTHHAFFGEPPLNISDSLKSLISSFFPLASTAIIAHVLIILISLSFVLVIGIVLMLVHSLGFAIDYNSLYFMWFSVIIAAILIAIIIYFYVEWSLAFVVVVVESKWGFTALMRSSYLVKGMRSVSLLLMLYFGVFSALIMWICYAYAYVHVIFVVVMILGSFCVIMLLVRITAANTVLYNYCKALHGELAIEVGEEFVYDYMDLASDGETVPRVVTVVAA